MLSRNESWTTVKGIYSPVTFSKYFELSKTAHATSLELTSFVQRLTVDISIQERL